MSYLSLFNYYIKLYAFGTGRYFYKRGSSRLTTKIPFLAIANGNLQVALDTFNIRKLFWYMGWYPVPDS